MGSLEMRRALLWLALLTGCPETGGLPPGPNEDPAVDADAAPPRSGDPDASTADAPDAQAAPWVRFAEPADGAVVDNPVRFRIEAGGGVDEVEVFADEVWSLGAAWDPRQDDELVYRFVNTGVPRALRVVGRVQGVDVASADLTVTPLAESCDEAFFVREFDDHNEDPSGALDLPAMRERALDALRAEIAALEACGANVTLGGMTALLLYESALRVGAYNTRCEENSYNRTATDCDADPEALYSYQLGLGALHTSNLHPCRGGAWTRGMRERFLAAAAAAGFETGDDLVTPAVADRFAAVCPDASPSAVDYYLLSVHDVFGVPRDGAGNHLPAVGEFPLFTPAVSIHLAFSEIAASCADIADDRDAIRAFGGADSRYGDRDLQDRILASWTSFACP